MAVSSLTKCAIRVFALTLSMFHVYVGYAGSFYPYVQRAVPLLLATVIVFLTTRAHVKKEKDAHAEDQQSKGTISRVPIYDWLGAGLAILSFGYIVVFSEYLTDRWPMTQTFAPTPYEIVFGVIGSILLLEVCRRTFGIVVVLMCIGALAYAYLGHHIGWSLFSHRGFSFLEIIDQMYLTLEGIWGGSLGVAANYIVLFVIFGAVSERAGLAAALIEISSAITGHLKGGPAKVAILASGMVGSVTGSTIANVYTVGQFTIPMMKRVGYRPQFAGAVEALASNGGQIMPPVLGAAAFILAAYANVPYGQVALACLVPAFIYYACLYWFIHLEASKHSLNGIPKHEKPSLRGVLVKRGHLLIPLFGLIGLLIYGLSPTYAAFLAIIVTIVVSWFRSDTRMGPRDIIQALEQGGKDASGILIICAAIGFIIGTFVLTGLGLNVSSIIISLAGGHFLMLLLMVFLACLILGTGMNTVAAFLLVSVVAVPALTEQGIDLLVANLFVFYAALLSHITPPVCLAIFAAATIANANSWATAYEGIRMGIIAYLLPFIIVFFPSLLIIRGDIWDIGYSILSVLGGSMAVTVAFQGWLLGRIGLIERAAALCGGLLLLWPTTKSTIAGATIVVLVLIVSWLRQKRSEVAPSSA